ncbi:hypothetical protein PC123_g14503 [Phytophthora cactorum]|nr:hypothetical protein PC123_g14503 [Phytophthora cactorum]
MRNRFAIVFSDSCHLTQILGRNSCISPEVVIEEL